MILRHDVDLSLDAALGWRSSRRTAGAAATYFLMTRERVLQPRLAVGPCARSSGCASWATASDCTPCGRTSTGTSRFDPVLAWHNPDPEYMREPVEGFVNVMEAPWADVYRSDSNQHWRQGCPHEELAAGAFERLQLLTHPEIWVYPGATMRETMLAMLDAERGRRLDQLAADRIDLS